MPGTTDKSSSKLQPGPSELLKCIRKFINYSKFVDAGKLFESPVDRIFTIEDAINEIEVVGAVAFEEQRSLLSLYYRYFENRHVKKYKIINCCTTMIPLPLEQIGVLYLEATPGPLKITTSKTILTGLPKIILQTNRGYDLIRGLAHSLLYSYNFDGTYDRSKHESSAIYIENVIRKKYGHEYSDLFIRRQKCLALANLTSTGSDIIKNFNTYACTNTASEAYFNREALRDAHYYAAAFLIHPKMPPVAVIKNIYMSF